MSTGRSARTLARLAVLALALGAASGPQACINETGTNLEGEPIELLGMGPEAIEQRLDGLSPARLAKRLRQVTERARREPGLVSHNDLAATLLRANRPEPALRLLLALERRHPGEYAVAANLGTAYELLGRDQEALRWIREGIARNPDSHHGTEWLHVRILEAKLSAGGVDGQRSLLGLDFGQAVAPARPRVLPAGNDGTPVSLYALATALRYQVLERAGLVPAPDPVVASLMRDWADLEMLAGSIEIADLMYRHSQRYGAASSPLVAARQARIGEVLATAPETPAAASAACELCRPPEG